jgi:hypothetical protein
MMWRVALAALIAVLSLFVLSAPHAQFNGCSAGFCNPPSASSPPPSTTTFNPAQTAATITLSNGNLTATANSNSGAANTRSISCHSTGKFYAEFTIGTSTGGGTLGIGIADNGELSWLGSGTHSVAMYDGGQVYYADATTTTYNSFAATNIVSMAVDVGGGLEWWRVGSGNWNNSGSANPATGAGGFSATLSGTICAAVEEEATTNAVTANFGATSYAQSVPAGFGNW